MATEFTAAQVNAAADMVDRDAIEIADMVRIAAMLRLLAEKLREEENEAAERKHCDDETRRCGDGGTDQ